MKVVIYSKNNCPACERMKTLLSAKGIDYEVKNIDSDYDAMDFIIERGHRAMPVVYRDGIAVPPTDPFLHKE